MRSSCDESKRHLQQFICLPMVLSPLFYQVIPAALHCQTPFQILVPALFSASLWNTYHPDIVHVNRSLWNHMAPHSLIIANLIHQFDERCMLIPFDRMAESCRIYTLHCIDATPPTSFCAEALRTKYKWKDSPKRRFFVTRKWFFCSQNWGVTVGIYKLLYPSGSWPQHHRELTHEVDVCFEFD